MGQSVSLTFADRALKLIGESATAKGTLLDLRQLQLQQVPPKFSQEVADGGLLLLRELLLSDNQLSSLPDSVAQLAELRCIDLYRNDFTLLPAQLYALTKLRVLTASFNQIESVPEEIGALQHLEELNLTSNRITQLPAALCRLPVLRKLSVASNKLTELPDGLGLLHGSLKKLYLSSNELTSIAPVTGCTSLVKLYLKHNKIEALPDGIAALRNLQVLSIEANPLHEFPLSMADMTGLHTLHSDAWKHETLRATLPPHLGGNKLTLVSRQLRVDAKVISPAKAVTDIFPDGHLHAALPIDATSTAADHTLEHADSADVEAIEQGIAAAHVTPATEQ